MWTRVELKSRAKELMKKNYSTMLLISLIVMILDGTIYNGFVNIRTEFDISTTTYAGDVVPFQEEIISTVVPFIVAGSLFLSVLKIAYNIFIINPIVVGEQKFYVDNRKQEGTLNNLFYAFKHNYMNTVKIMFLMYLKTFLWTLLLIIPGIVKSYEYSMIPYILAENPDISTSDAFALSKRLTDDQKMDMFVLDLSFLGWLILCLFTCGIGTIFLTPYMKATTAELYFKLKEIKGISVDN